MKRSQRVKKDRAKRLASAAETGAELKKSIEVEDDPARRTTQPPEPDTGVWERARLLLAWESLRFE